jgi:hypothetical protein
MLAQVTANGLADQRGQVGRSQVLLDFANEKYRFGLKDYKVTTPIKRSKNVVSIAQDVNLRT